VGVGGGVGIEVDPVAPWVVVSVAPFAPVAPWVVVVSVAPVAPVAPWVVVVRLQISQSQPVWDVHTLHHDLLNQTFFSCDL
jgi:hypothetical protein